MKEPRLLSTDKVAELLDLSPETIKHYRKMGVPFFSDKAVKVGRALRWRESDLEAYINDLEYVA